MNLLSRLALTGIASLVLCGGGSEAKSNVDEAFNKDYLKEVFSNPIEIPRDYRRKLGDNWQEQILGDDFADDTAYKIKIQEATKENDFGGSENGLQYQVPRKDGNSVRIQFKINYMGALTPDEMKKFMEHLQNLQRLNKETLRKLIEESDRDAYRNFGSIPLERGDLYGRVLRPSTGENKTEIDVWKDFWDNAFKNLNKPEVIDLRGR